MSENTDILRKEMTPRVVKVWYALPPVFIDGLLVTFIAGLTALAAGLANFSNIFANDDTYKYIDPVKLFWIKLTLTLVIVIIGTIASSLVALQSFRSKSFAEHVAKQQAQAAEQKSP